MRDELLGKPWAQAPWDLVCAPISAQAFRVLMAIQLHRRPEGKAPFPSQRRLAEMCHVSAPTIQRSMAELVEKGYLIVERDNIDRSSHRTNRYTLRVVPLRRITGDASRQGQGITDDASRGITDDASKESRRRGSRKDPVAASAATSGAHTSMKAQYDALWEAFIAAGVERPSTKSERNKLNKAVRELLDAGADPADIAKRKKKYMQNYPGIRFTALGLVGHWGESKPGAGRGMALVTECPECVAAGVSPVCLAGQAMKEHRYNAHDVGTVCLDCGGVVMPDIKDTCPCGKLTNEVAS